MSETPLKFADFYVFVRHHLGGFSLHGHEDFCEVKSSLDEKTIDAD